MCGIVGVVGKKNAHIDVLEGLRRLEYRGYDSAGIASLQGPNLELRKALGKISVLERRIDIEPFNKNIITALGHTRWATHGEPSEDNAHPQVVNTCAVVHNGIIENYVTLRREMIDSSIIFKSDTDTETIPALISHMIKNGKERLDAIRSTIQKCEGAFALGIAFKGVDDTLYATRRGVPLIIGIGEDCHYLTSDPAAIAQHTNKFIFLENDDIAIITKNNLKIYQHDDTLVERPVKVIDISNAVSGKAGYRHFMLKEIHEQPTVVAHLIQRYIDHSTGQVNLPNIPCDFNTVPQINIVACGTAYYAGLVGKYYLEQLAHIPVNVDVASEFRYRQPPLVEGGLFIAISQSGETADTIAALEYAKEQGQHVLAITNTPTSTIARKADAVIEILAEAEIAVASTKAFMGMLISLALLALEAAQQKGEPPLSLKDYIQALRELPSKLTEILSNTQAIDKLAQDFRHTQSMLYLGRSVLYPLAQEGALKIKEVSYIHAEAYASGEMKHGPIALVDENLPVVNLASSNDGMFEKTISNMKEIEARHGQIVLITDAIGISRLDDAIVKNAKILTVPKTNPFVLPMVYAVPLQLLAYYVAVEKGTDVDQPRNLAKSVTVE